jgi:Na+-driven multidrug efflux pump
MQFTVTLFVGNAIGAMNIQKAKKFALAAIILVESAEILIIVLALLTRNSLCNLFTNDT